MNTERKTLTAKRAELLAEINSSGKWDQTRYDEVVDLNKRITAMPDDIPESKLELKPPKKGR